MFQGCDGVGSGGQGFDTGSANFSNTFKSFRLGQTESANSPVATTAAANNGEAIIILNSSENEADVEVVIYVSEDQDIVRLTIGEDNRLVTATNGDTRATFSNFTTNTVQVQNVDKADQAPRTISIDPDVVKIINSGIDGRIIQDPQVIRRLLRIAIQALKVFGCTGREFARLEGLPESFANVSNAACESLLVDIILTRLASNSDLEFLTGLPENDACNFEEGGWFDDFSFAETCARGLSRSLLDLVNSETPNVDIALFPNSSSSSISSSSDSGVSDSGSGGTTGDSGTSSGGTTGGGTTGGGGEPMPPLNCELGFYSCLNGEQICLENACNGSSDCSDGSDELSSICRPDVICCLENRGCPNETPGSCALECCCCNAGQLCDQNTLLNGCTNDSNFRAGKDQYVDPLSKYRLLW
jgi:uncharacterized membrane protein YgcG